MIDRILVRAEGQGLFPITNQVAEVVSQAGRSEGLCNLFVQHTSASLLIQENADPSAREDLERWLNRLVPEGDALYRHTQEGPDDMPAHIKSALTASSLAIPILDGRLALGVWQGIFLWEHRRQSSARTILIHLGD
jgi:secondary thiamine-phosphate synthase enzyme